MKARSYWNILKSPFEICCLSQEIALWFRPSIASEYKPHSLERTFIMVYILLLNSSWDEKLLNTLMDNQKLKNIHQNREIEKSEALLLQFFLGDDAQKVVYFFVD